MRISRLTLEERDMVGSLLEIMFKQHMEDFIKDSQAKVIYEDVEWRTAYLHSYASLLRGIENGENVFTEGLLNFTEAWEIFLQDAEILGDDQTPDDKCGYTNGRLAIRHLFEDSEDPLEEFRKLKDRLELDWAYVVDTYDK